MGTRLAVRPRRLLSIIHPRCAVALTLLLATACNPVYAPPVRGAHHGAPARLSRDRMELGAAGAGYSYPVAGEGHAALAIEDWVSVEAGLGLMPYSPGWAMGWLGARFTRAPEAETDLVADLEVGLGAGVGGADCASDAGCAQWTDMTAGGGYLGFGVGLRADFFSLYLRSRVEMGAADGVPVTFWPTAMLGLEFLVDRTFAFGAGGGYLAIINDLEPMHGWFWQLQLAVLFDLPAAGDA